MSTQEDDKAKAKNVSKVPPLQPTRNPTEVLEHLKKVCVALHLDGFRRGVNKIDPTKDRRNHHSHRSNQRNTIQSETT